MTPNRPTAPLTWIALAAVAAVLSPRAPSSAEDEPRRLDPRDRDVLKAAVHDLADPKSPVYEGDRKEKSARPRIVLDRVTRPTVFMGDSMFQRFEKERGFSDELRRDWKRRNEGGPVSLAELGEKDEVIVIDDIEAMAHKVRGEGPDAFALEFRKAHPEAERWVTASLPAYTLDGRTAVVVLEGGPAPHGISWVFQCAREGGRWVVVWRHRHWWW